MKVTYTLPGVLPEATPAPIQLPRTDAATSDASRTGSTSTATRKMNAWTTTGSERPTIMVPTMHSSATTLNILYAAVVVAIDPMPSVSKKLVTNPTTVSVAVGACCKSDFAATRPRTARRHAIAKTIARAVKLASKAVLMSTGDADYTRRLWYELFRRRAFPSCSPRWLRPRRVPGRHSSTKPAPPVTALMRAG